MQIIDNYPKKMCDKFLDKLRQDYIEKLFANKSFITEKSFLQLSEDDSHIQKISAHVAPVSVTYPKVNLYYAFAEDTHPMKRIIVASKFFEKEKLLPQSMPCKELFNIQDPYLENEVINHYLRTDPLSFVIFGKPEINHTVVASAIADAWNCVLISPISLIRQEIDSDTEKGRYIERILRLGRSIGPKIVMNLIRCRVRMRDVKHRGYVVACLPFIPNNKSFDDSSYSSSVLDTNLTYPEFCENAAVKTCEVHEDQIISDASNCEVQFDYEREIPQQIDEIFTVWPKKPLIIIYLVCPKQDITSKCARQRIDPLTDNIFDENEFTMQLFDDESENDESNTSFDFSQVVNERSFLNTEQRLLRLISNMMHSVEIKYNLYERLALPVIDKWILAHNPQYVIRVDGRTSARRILQIVETRLCTLALQPSILPKKIIEQNDVRSSETFPKMNMSDELAEKSAEEAFEILRRRGILSSKFLWRLSAWKFYCPVELAQGRSVKGLSKYAVRFLNKIFFLSSLKAENLFVENPRTFLLPPNPRPTCKIAIFGPKYAGKSELSARLAEVFGGTVINVDGIVKELIKQHKESPNLYKNNLDVQILLKSIDILTDEKADIIIQNIKKIPDEKLEDELRRDGGYVVDGMCMDIKVWRKIVADANIVLEDVIVLFEEEPYTYLLNKFRSFFHFNDLIHETEYDTEADYEEYKISHEDKEWEYLEHLIQFESEWIKFEEHILEFGANIIKCNLANIKDVTEYTINYIRSRFDTVATDEGVEEKNEEYEVLKETVVENETNLANKNAKELHSIYTIDLVTAERFLDCGYYFFSSFGRWCPVQIYTDEIPIQMFLPMKAKGQIFPVIHHSYIYFVAGEKELSAFLNNPSKYVAWNPCPLFFPLRISIIGPPKCGKTTLANRFAKMYGIKVITRGKALRHMLKYYPWTESARETEKQLRAGQAASIESVTRAIEMFSIGPRAATQGYVLDDCPSNRKEAEQLALLGIQPMIVLDLKADLDFCLECLFWNDDGIRRSSNFSANFLSQRYMNWHVDQASFRDWLKRFSQNVIELDATKSKWHIWTRANHVVCSRFADIMLYFREADLDKVHSLKNMCVSPYEFRSRQSRYESFCPICLFRENILKTSGQSVDSQGMVQFREYFYWICPRHIDVFVKDPLQYFSPIDVSLLDERPRILQEIVDVEHACWARRLQVGGFCLVTYVDSLPDRKLMQGRTDLSVIFKDKVYLFCSEECREKFLTQHNKYSELDIVFPHEFPSIEAQRLPDLTFLEQTVTKTVIKAVNSVAAHRPKIFGLSVAVSAAIYIGVYLKTQSENLYEVDNYEAASKRMAGRNRFIEIVTDTMKKKLNPYVSLPKYPS